MLQPDGGSTDAPRCQVGFGVVCCLLQTLLCLSVEVKNFTVNSVPRKVCRVVQPRESTPHKPCMLNPAVVVAGGSMIGGAAGRLIYRSLLDSIPPLPGHSQGGTHVFAKGARSSVARLCCARQCIASEEQQHDRIPCEQTAAETTYFESGAYTEGDCKRFQSRSSDVQLSASVAEQPDDRMSEILGVRYRSRVLYDGAEFAGMQQQPSGTAVSDCLEKVLAKRFQRAIRVASAGRTDAGVHARGQVVHFDVPILPRTAGAETKATASPTPEALQRSLNAMLPTSLRLVDMELAPEVDAHGRQWHARLWATGKLYSYRIYCGQVMDPLVRSQRYHAYFDLLSLDRMAEAAAHLEGGPLDCAAFANKRMGESAPIEWDPESTTRVIRKIELIDEGSGNLRLDFHVQGALYKMIRNMVGLLLDVGRGKVDPADVPRLVEGRDRGKLPMPAPAHGLTLESVYYSEGWDGRYDHPLHSDLDSLE